MSDPVAAHPLLAGLTVLERGWLSSNNIVIHPVRDEAGAVLVDTGHVNHAEQTVALVRQALDGRPLAMVVNTHLHSDHCGGNASLQRAFGRHAWVPSTLADAVRDWDGARLTHDTTGQRCEPFTLGGALAAGDVLVAGGRRWEALAAPGHDPDALLLFDAEHGVLLSADALWENGFGIVFPEIVGEPGFDDVAATLDLIERLSVRMVVPGHGRVFTDVAAALGRARQRLVGYRTDPQRHARHALKVLLKYHMMEERTQSRAELLRWASQAPMLRAVMDSTGRQLRVSAEALCTTLLDELLASGALVQLGDEIRDA